MNYLEELNESQYAAVVNTNGPTMVIAGAGSGKTRVLTYRIAHMMENGVDPFDILALTFTNKAAKEMTERIGTIVGPSEAKNITMGTFHSVFSRILRYNAHRIGFPSDFTIYDTQDSKSVLKDIVKGLNLDEKLYKPSVMLGRISSAKNNLISPQAYSQNKELTTEDDITNRPETARIYRAYAMRCFKSGAMDFDDLLYLTNVLIRDFPDVLAHYQHKFKYILVDEYQDTNYSQYLIVKKLAAVYENICVVGDDAQSIYSFRGANIQNILNFKKDYPDFKLFKLEQNYRSTKNIVEAANSIIERNKDQIKKNVWTSNDDGSKIKVIRTLTDNEEGKVISNRIYDLTQGSEIDFKDIAILYRTNKQSRSFEEALRKLNIPYKIFGGLSFFQRKEIKDLLAYFRLATNPNDEEALKRVINYPLRGIGKTTVEHLMIASNQHNVSVWTILNDFNAYPVPISSSAKNKISEFAIMIQSFQAQMDKMNAFEMGQHIAKSSGILKELTSEKDKGPEEVERFQNVEALLAGMKEFTMGKTEGNKLSDYMMDVALLTEIDQNTGEEETNYVTLMTIHSSKGLEFGHVFLVGLEENLFPSQMVLQSRTELEEERRLFYVAVTRAKISCTLSYATSRFVFGSLTTSEPSRFINEIKQEYLQFESTPRPGGRSLSGRSTVTEKPSYSKFGGMTGRNPSMKPVSQVTSSARDTSGINFMVGDNVEHKDFGGGKITTISGEGSNKKATIFFPGLGAKQVLLAFAKLKLVEND
jgi:DNA helicase II / ATP-dependent DNA helicase PcrA